MIKIPHLRGINDCIISFVIAFICLISFNAFSANDRIALIIGNSKYQNLGKLNNTINDAKAIEKNLKEIGYKTKIVFDVNENQIRKEIKSFALESERASLALLFYAGHGAQVYGDNYILPIDLEIPQRESDIQLSGIRIDDVINSIRSKTKVIFLDACRDNPALVKNLTKGRGSYQGGLASTKNSSLLDTNSGVFIAYSTDSGNIALDGNGQVNSPFTSSLIRFIKEPISIDDMFSKVTKDVKEKTNNSQKPYKYASIDGVVCLTFACNNTPQNSFNSNKISIENITGESVKENQNEIKIAMIANNSSDAASLTSKFPKRKNVTDDIKEILSNATKNWVLINFGFDPNDLLYIDAKSIEKKNSYVKFDSKIVYDDSNKGAFFSKNYANCENFKSLLYEVNTLDKDNKILTSNTYGEPETMREFSDNKEGTLMYSLISLACNPLNLIPLSMKSNAMEWIKAYTITANESERENLKFDKLDDDEKADIFYNNESIYKQENSIFFILKIKYRKNVPISYLLPYKGLVKFRNVPQFAEQFQLVELKCKDKTYYYKKFETVNSNGELISIGGYLPKDSINPYPIVERTVNFNMYERHCN
jgi:hypothetical protein